MTYPLPPSADLVNTGITKGTFKSALSSLRAYLNSLLGADGEQSTALSTLGVPFNGTLQKSGAYTVVAADRGKVIECTGTWTLSIGAVASLGSGFFFGAVNSGAGVITLDANLSELIGSATTLVLNPGESVALSCNGTLWNVFGRSGVSSFNTRGGAVTLTSADVTTALGSSVYVPTDANLGVGCFVIGCPTAGSTTHTAGTSYTGVSSVQIGTTSTSELARHASLSGTWRCLVGCSTGLTTINTAGFYQRTA